MLVPSVSLLYQSLPPHSAQEACPSLALYLIHHHCPPHRPIYFTSPWPLWMFHPLDVSLQLNSFMRMFCLLFLLFLKGHLIFFLSSPSWSPYPNFSWFSNIPQLNFWGLLNNIQAPLVVHFLPSIPTQLSMYLPTLSVVSMTTDALDLPLILWLFVVYVFLGFIIPSPSTEVFLVVLYWSLSLTLTPISLGVHFLWWVFYSLPFISHISVIYSRFLIHTPLSLLPHPLFWLSVGWQLMILKELAFTMHLLQTRSCFRFLHVLTIYLSCVSASWGKARIIDSV